MRPAPAGGAAMRSTRALLETRLDALVVCISKPERHRVARGVTGGCSYLLSAKVAEAEVGFRLQLAKVASLACR